MLLLEQNKACGIAAWPSKAIDEAGTYRINSVRKHDRHSAGGRLQCRHGWACCGRYDVRYQCN